MAAVNHLSSLQANVSTGQYSFTKNSERSMMVNFVPVQSKLVMSHYT